MILKNCDLTLKALDVKNRIVEGYFSAFGNVDSDGDIIQMGAAAKSIMEQGPGGKNRIKHLYNHWDAVGVIEELKEDEVGIRFRSKIGTHTLGNDVLAMYSDGIITEHSFGFNTIKSEQGNIDSKPVRIITELKMWEGSSLDKWGANENTPVIKSLDDFQRWRETWLKRYDALTKALSSRTNYSDETYENIVVQIQSLKAAFEVTLEKAKPLASTLPITEPFTQQQKGLNSERLTELFNQIKL
jgi:uncharacterized protein